MKVNYKKVLIIFIIAIIVLLIIISAIGIPRIKGHLYSGNHITVYLTINLDGSTISLKDLNATCIYENKDDCIVSSDNGTYKTKGGEYGEYSFELIIPKDRINGYDSDIIVKLNYLNANNWYISESNCVINLYNSDNSISGSSDVTVKYNDGTSENHIKDVELDKNIIKVNWGL